jgi:amino acid permease
VPFSIAELGVISFAFMLVIVGPATGAALYTFLGAAKPETVKAETTVPAREPAHAG